MYEENVFARLYHGSLVRLRNAYEMIVEHLLWVKLASSMSLFGGLSIEDHEILSATTPTSALS